MIRRMFVSQTLVNALVTEYLAITILRTCIAGLDGENCARDTRSGETISDHKVDQIRDFIMSDLTRNLSLDDLAGVAGVSPFHFARAFKQATGLSPLQYVLEQRLSSAREALATSKSSLADIAYDVGFSSQAHMTDVFKKRLGVTPGRYRKQLAA